MIERRRRKAINFDLDTKKLNEHGFVNTSPAYAKIRRAFGKLGFERRQYSGYVSVASITKKEAQDVAEAISLKLPWLSQCVQRFDITDIGNQYDLIIALKNAGSSQYNKYIALPEKPVPAVPGR